MCSAYRSADAVFDATVVRITLSSRTETIAGRERRIEEKLVSVNVHQSWKGAEPGALEIATARDGAACGYDFKKGRRYLVFAYRRTDGRLTVSICGSTREARSPKFDPSRCTDPSASSSESFACSLERRVPTLACGYGGQGLRR
jgi:hypothetical protein